ncbi:LysR family transcriptional regulator [Clostridium sp. AF22-10]|uniref:LysR family transcriptional regulator n=1 Tax=Clostridium sp. AF22-10 TaxID=2293004 RepID=UPI000E52A27B|nr:LysR family transcriptional regulator [Clostridium sp. AF22-10]
MNFQSMEYFAAVAKNRSFTRAADALHITQQTLSAHIAGIERELGCPLLIRHIPLELTYAGEVFLRYATEFNTKYDCMLHEFGDILNNQTGKLRIGIAFTRGHAIMPELIAAFQKEYPGVDVELVESSNDVLQKYLLDGTIDLAIANFQFAFPASFCGISMRKRWFSSSPLPCCRTFTANRPKPLSRKSAAITATPFWLHVRFS